MKRILVLSLGLLAACGEDAKEVAAVDKCEADGFAVYAVGDIVTDAGTFKIKTALKEANGNIKGQDLQIELGDLQREADAPTILLKIRENTAQDSLLDNFANAANDGPVTLSFSDASNPDAMAVRRSDLAGFPCSIADGTTCGQIALDTADPNVISDNDDKVYNFKSGTFSIVEVNNTSSRLSLKFDAVLGPNILKTGDTSTGQIQGCINPKYASLGPNGISLR